MAVFVIARLSFLEASRRWILWAALILGVAFLAIYAIGFNEIRKDTERSISNAIASSETYNFLMMAGLYVVNFLTVMMTVLSSVDAISGEIASGVIHTLLSKPVRRWQVILGKWLGFEMMLSLYLFLMAGGVIAVTYWLSKYHSPNLWNGLGLMWLNTALLLSITFLGGTVLSTIANGVLAFGLYGIAFIGGWIEQFGSFFQNQNAINIGILCSLLIPSEAIWRRASYEMQSALASAMGGFANPFSLGATPSQAMIVYAVLYTLTTLGLAVRKFSQRDL